MWGVQVKLRSVERVLYLSALEVRSRRGAIQIHVYLYLYLTYPFIAYTKRYSWGDELLWECQNADYALYTHKNNLLLVYCLHRKAWDKHRYILILLIKTVPLNTTRNHLGQCFQNLSHKMR